MTEEERSPEKPIIEDEWLIRPCHIYKEEYQDCTSVKGRFHQYFVYGETLDCSQWKRDFDDCVRWTDNKDVKSGKNVLKSEENRRMDRLKAHYKNNVWQKREKPPEDWAKPLPEYLQKRYENTFLALKAKELDGKDVSDEGISFLERKSYCVVM